MATIDYKALAERIEAIARGFDARSRTAFTDRSSERHEERAADLRTVVSLLEGMAEAKPVGWLVTGGRLYEDVPCSSLEYAELRQRERDDGSQIVPLYLHPAPQPQPAQPPDGAPYGIIDPDYGRVYTIARKLAWEEGYAIGLHGSFTRDLDMIAVPWADAACEPEHLIRRIADATGLKIRDGFGVKPHGRRAWTLLFPAFADPRFVDLSIMPRGLADEKPQPERQPVSEQRFALPKHLVLQITTAYEQGFGHAFRDTLNNPYSTGSHEAEAWDRGREEGRKRNVIEQTEAQIECHGLDTPERVCFYEQEFYVLSNFSAFSINWKGRRFPTSEHAYHWEKFPQGTRDGELFVRDVIVDAESAHAAFKMAEGWRQLRRPDWDEIKVEVMREILRAKAMQHEYVRRKLLATGDRELVENSWRDDFWGWGPNRNGQNMLGKLWMEVRAELRAALAAKETK